MAKKNCGYQSPAHLWTAVTMRVFNRERKKHLHSLGEVEMSQEGQLRSKPAQAVLDALTIYWSSLSKKC